MFTMMIQHYNQSDEVTVALDYLNYLFTGIFTIEAIIRLIAMRLEYFKSFMNIFDFTIVIFSVGGMYYHCFYACYLRAMNSIFQNRKIQNSYILISNAKTLYNYLFMLMLSCKLTSI